MNPDNIACLSVAEIDFCALANNHVLDWGYTGLTETVETLKNAGIKSAGVGSSLHEAEQPAIFEINGKGRVYLFSYGAPGCGIPLAWKATDKKPGVNLLQELSDKTVNSIKELINRTEQPEDVIVISIHWGGNWGYDISPEHVKFAHKLIDEAGVDVIHGHSSHHIKGIEVYNNKLIIYGCGDFINDYEGISGNESFRDDLSLMYFVSIETSVGNLVSLKMIPTQIRHFKVNRASKVDIEWVKEVLNREGSKFGTWVELNKDSTLSLRWK
jgi:poly-gamma-glutamate synthesis protein (capsule biosynthesis protein)